MAAIPPRKNACIWTKPSPGSEQLNEEVRASKRFGRSLWKQWSGYHLPQSSSHIRTVQELLRLAEVAARMIYRHDLTVGGAGARCPPDTFAEIEIPQSRR